MGWGLAGLEIDTSQIRSNKQVFMCACHTGPFMGTIWGFEVEWMTDSRMDSFPYDVWLSHLGFQYKRNEPTIPRWWGFTEARQRDTITSTGMTSKIYAYTTSMYMKHTYVVTCPNIVYGIRVKNTKRSHTCSHFTVLLTHTHTGWHCAHMVPFRNTHFQIHNLKQDTWKVVLPIKGWTCSNYMLNFAVTAQGASQHVLKPFWAKLQWQKWCLWPVNLQVTLISNLTIMFSW